LAALRECTAWSGSPSPWAPPSRCSFARVARAARGRGFLHRLSRGVRKGVHHLLRRCEDPEAVINDAMGELEWAVVRAWEDLSRQLDKQTRLREQFKVAQDALADLHRRTRCSQHDHALRRRREEAQNRAEDLQDMLLDLQSTVDGKQDALREHHRRFELARREQSLLVARAREARTASEVSELLSCVMTHGTDCARLKEIAEHDAANEGVPSQR